MAIEKSFWLSYDLGLKGDYKGLYTILDSLQAQECGDGIAYFKLKTEYLGNIVDVLKVEIVNRLNLSSTDRLYVIYLDSTTQKIKGLYLYGQRKRAPWDGYSSSGKSEIQIDE